jgi:hypothetical protein
MDISDEITENPGQSENLDPSLGQETNKTDSINLASNLQKIKNRYQPTPSFRLKHSINFNPNPEY